MTSRHRDGTGRHAAPTGRRADPARAILVLALALLMAGLQPWNHGYSANAPAIGGLDCTIGVFADHGSGDRDTGIPAASHCLLHAGCVVSLDAKASMSPVSYASGWPVFNPGTDVGPGSCPDPRPPNLLA